MLHTPGPFYNMDSKWSNFAKYLYMYSRYNTDWIANTEIVLDHNNSVIKRLRCTRFCVNRPANFWRRFLSVFYHSWAWQPSWSCDPNFAIKLSFPLPMDAPHKISL